MTYKIFEAFGVELEYMLVDATTLNVRPMADTLLACMNKGLLTSDVPIGKVTWSNELSMHVLELKVTEPTNRLSQVSGWFESAIVDLRDVLDRCHLRILPTGMHPWMDPASDVVLWPHEGHQIYAAFDEHFDCRSHGWGNVQSVHLNLPFDGDEQFRRLHSAVRLILPLLPALSASSPICEGRVTQFSDTRMQYYAEHCQEMPTLMGDIIPPSVGSEMEYRSRIYAPIELDCRQAELPEFMNPEFMNARGAIARFDRGSIEIRVMDVQEYPTADVAICAAAIAVLRKLVSEDWCDFQQQFDVPTEILRSCLEQTTQFAERAIIDSGDLLRCFGISRDRIAAGDFWKHVLSDLHRDDQMLKSLYAPLEVILNQGSLSTRIIEALDGDLSLESIADVYDQLAECLVRWEPFTP